MSFSPATVSLHGRHLIEASAGTGKTYSIANLFLRLLLEPHLSQPNMQPLLVDQILVVTFTNAATDELRGRIRKKIEEALQCFRSGISRDAFIEQYARDHLTDETARNLACERLYNALLLVDDASIFTIHSFAARAIQTFLFETGALADVEVKIGGSDRETQWLDDIARLLTVGEHSNLGLFLSERGVDGRKYASSINAILKRSGVNLLISPLSLDDCMAQYEQTRDDLLKERVALSGSWSYIDTNDKKNAALIGDALQEIGGEASSRNIKDCIKFMNDKFSGVCGIHKFGKTQSVIFETAHADALTGLAKDLYCRVKNLADFNTNEENFQAAVSIGLSALLKLLQQRKQAMDLAQMQPDDVVHLLNEKLNDPQAADILRHALTQQYPVCMVDEFQDTDPDQFRMFDRLYQHTENLGLFAIGDPKQSIYAFRGADVFSYLDVKSRVKKTNIHTLDINFRSKQGVIDGVNALFGDVNQTETGQPVFVYSGIEYGTVYSCENPPAHRGVEPQSRGIYRVGKKEPASLVFVGYENDESQTFNNLRPIYAEDCAERILRLLQGSQSATVEKNGVKTPVTAGDIAVLVSDYSQADAIKASLAKKNLSAVYLAQKDSVFSSCLFATDLLFVLRAMDEPNNLHHLKSAFATPLMRHFQVGTELLDALNTDDGLEKAIEQFSFLCKCWESRGIFYALYQLFDRFALSVAFSDHADCDRLMTDFRHLGDLLQQQYLLTGSRERLIDWYACQLLDDSALDEDAKSIRLESDDNLIKIVTLHGCKGLEYPVVFIPFFFGTKEVDLGRDPPFYHRQHVDGGWESVLDFQSNNDAIGESMQRERMAEAMRLLYVGITRAIYQCYIGISRSHHASKNNHLFPKTCWAHLLNLQDDASPSWSVIQEKLQQRMGDAPCAYETVLASDNTYKPRASVNTVEGLSVQQAVYPSSFWQITSYSALAYQKDMRNVSDSKQDEAPEASSDLLRVADTEEELQWKNNIRYSLRGGANTGDCLHNILERVAKGEALDMAVPLELRAFGLAPKAIGALADAAAVEVAQQEQQQAVANWMLDILATPLSANVPSLGNLFADAYVLPECGFDFSIGSNHDEVRIADISNVLQSTCGALSGIARKDNKKQINGMMTGFIDLLFIHDKKIYVLDYKSNTLGKSPSFYGEDEMRQAMQESRYDLQYLIYSVAAHRYMKQRLGDRYAFDGGEYSFGGAFYLFLRGMGIQAYPQHGIYFSRPTAQQIAKLDSAFAGKEIRHA